jgi:hypothetical protein
LNSLTCITFTDSGAYLYQCTVVTRWQVSASGRCLSDIPVVGTPLLLYCLVALAGGGVQLERSLTAAEIWARMDVQLFILRQ